MPKDQHPKFKFADELLSVLVRWSKESDLTSLEMAEVTAVVINNFCNEETITFEPDEELLDELED